MTKIDEVRSYALRAYATTGDVMGNNGSGVMWDCLKLEAGFVVTSGIDNIYTESDSLPIEYYDLRGHRVAVPQKSGIYIWRQGNRSGKLVK